MENKNNNVSYNGDTMNSNISTDDNHVPISAEEIVANRNGEVLIQHSLLKSDHFPGCQNTKLRPLVEGAPNFRGIEGLHVYGVAIPTVVGLRNVLAILGAKNKKRRVTWINLREEPVLYVNGSPYVVRESDKPFANLEYSGIDSQRVEEMENRLKADVLSEASVYDGSIMVAHEDDQFQVVEDWEPVTEVDVQTPAEVYEELVHDGYDVDYLRVPVTDEKAPMGDDFEILMRKSWELRDTDAIIFNCQMGRGRTTTGMCIACMILLRKSQGHLSPPPIVPIDSLPKWWCYPEEFDMASPKASADDLKNGMFLSIRSMLRALENGRSAKLALDLILDACAAMQNLREAIATYRSRIFQEPNEMRRQSLLQVCLEYLDRYYSLIVFSAYLDDPGFAFGTKSHVSFSQWVKDRPELLGILERLLRANPLAALSFDQFEGQDFSKRNSLDKSVYANREESFAEHIAHRSGSVLGPHTILKLDHFKGCQSSRLPEKFRGAPNFRGLSSPGIHVYGGAIATVEGIKDVLLSVGAGPDDPCNGFAVWHMMREEPVIYINGEPFVLREASRPFKNLMEYRGIDSMRLDQMEQRLRDDVIQESSKFNGEIIVTVEEKKTDGSTTVKDTVIKILDTSLVETPRQVLEKFQSEGYRVNFIRIPLTDGTCPKPKDFDLFYGAAAAARPGDALIYTCQLGGGRTTTGMCIGSLLRMHLNGAAIPTMTQLERVATLERLDEDVGGLSPRVSGGDEIESYELQEETYQETPRTASKMMGAPDIDPERVNMENGEYIGVRRFTRTLERGAEAKVEVDAVIDACGVLVNLRTAIMRYRKPKFVETFFRPELQSRHSAFQRGCAYMERYCMLMAFSVYLHECRQKGRTLTFEDWLSTRTDITTAIDGIHQNPAGALAPVPMAPELTNINSHDIHEHTEDDADVSIIEARSILLRRRGHTIGKRTILKSYTIQGEAFGYDVPHEYLVEGITDIQGVKGLPILTVGNATISGLRKFMQQIGALPGGHSNVIFTDLREELVVYVNGTAYMRREVEMAAAALHHAGIKAVKLEDLERRLRTDVVNESIAWGGKILLHKELESSSSVSRLSFESEKTFSLSNFAKLSNGGSQEDITKTTSYQTNTFVSAFWERTGDGGDIDSGIWTPAEVFLGLAAEGYNLEYKRVPMSRERTPRTEDLDHLYKQVAPKRNSEQTYYVFLSRTANGSSARFAATFACATLMTLTTSSNHLKSSEEVPRMNLPRSDSEGLELSRSVESGEYRGIMNLLRALPRGGDAKSVVDVAIDRCKSIGNITKDILQCKMISADESDTLDSADSLFAKRLGLHYLKRYFYLIAFISYLESANETQETFKDWVDARKEISYLASVLDLE